MKEITERRDRQGEANLNRPGDLPLGHLLEEASKKGVSSLGAGCWNPSFTLRSQEAQMEFALQYVKHYTKGYILHRDMKDKILGASAQILSLMAIFNLCVFFP